MGGRNFYFLASLPALGDLGSVPPLGLAEFLAQVEDAGGPRAVTAMLFLGHDLLQREALRAGEIGDADLAVLTPAQARDEAPLPEFLVRREESIRRIPSDDVWEAYFAAAADTARQERSAFLAEHVAFEVGLRNALAAARARALDLEPREYMVGSVMGAPLEAYADLIGEWAAARDPLAGLRVIEAARWAWLAAHDGWFSFEDDEAAAYGAKLLVLHRWQRVAKAAHAGEAAADGAHAHRG